MFLYCPDPLVYPFGLSPCLLLSIIPTILFLYMLIFGTKQWIKLNRKFRKTKHQRVDYKKKSEAIWNGVLGRHSNNRPDETCDSSDEDMDEEAGIVTNSISNTTSTTNNPAESEDPGKIKDLDDEEDEADDANEEHTQLLTPSHHQQQQQQQQSFTPLITPNVLHPHLPKYLQVLSSVVLTCIFIIITTQIFDIFNIVARFTSSPSSRSKKSIPSPPLYVLFLVIAAMLPWIYNVALLLKENGIIYLKPAFRRRRRKRKSGLKYWFGGGVGWSWVVEFFWGISFVLDIITLYHFILYQQSLPELEKDYTVSLGLFITFVTRFALTGFLLAYAGLALWYRGSGRLETVIEKVWFDLIRLEEERQANAGLPQSTFLPDSEKYKPPSTFSDFVDKFQKLVPFIWPSGTKNRYLQFLIIMCMVLLSIGRVVNVLVPIQYKRVVDSLGGVGSPVNTNGTDINTFMNDDTERLARARLSRHVQALYVAYGPGGYHATDDTTNHWMGVLESIPGVIPWNEILMFVFLRFLQGGVGILSSLQNFLWIPVGQFTTREISVKMFSHLHHLSLRFHLNRKTGEILRVQDRGVSSIVSLLSSLLFNIIPTLIDIFIACAYFTLEFDLVFGFIVFVTMTSYIIATVVLTEWRTKYRRQANLLDNAMEAKAVDSLLNFETVKYYNAENYEINQYTDAIKEYQKADWKSSVSLSILNTAQNVIIQLGLLVGCLLCAKRIMLDRAMTVGDFVLYLSYITQLYGPLNWFGTYYRVIQKNFVDMEKMLDLFQEPVEVNDIPNAKDLQIKRGEVVFENVSFAYDPRLQTLHNISFRVEPGQTVALVGSSGSGKSTILRLLFRFYEVQKGRILIDGQDISQVSQISLRGAIGVVPQDTVLFNDTIGYNIRYGRPTASDEEMTAAARAAQIHEKILGFPDGYETKVGERGLRLSGGEKQRCAIARTFLKNPAIVLLDEATSALDTHTERHIQAALHEMTQNRTTLVIAHRLSTVVNADQILVLRDGVIVERGSHDSLMKNKEGIYYDMWMKQLRDDELSRLRAVQAEQEAKVAEAIAGVTRSMASGGGNVFPKPGLSATATSPLVRTQYQQLPASLQLQRPQSASAANTTQSTTNAVQRRYQSQPTTPNLQTTSDTLPGQFPTALNINKDSGDVGLVGTLPRGTYEESSPIPTNKIAGLENVDASERDGGDGNDKSS